MVKHVKTISKYSTFSILFGCALLHQGEKNTLTLSSLAGVNHHERIAYTQSILGSDFQHVNDVAQQKFNVYNFVYQEVALRMPKDNMTMHHRVTRAILTEAGRHHIDPLFLVALIQHESKFKHLTVGQHGEIGLMQIKPSTAIEIARRSDGVALSREQLFEPEINIRWGTEYMMSLRNKFRATPTAFLEAYNMGPSRWNARSKAGDLSPTNYSRTTRRELLDLYLKLGDQLKRSPLGHLASAAHTLSVN